MKLKNLELKLGDKITFNDGEIVYQDNETWINREHIKKVERYVKHNGSCEYKEDGYIKTNYNMEFYTLKTLYEKKEEIEVPSKEELQEKMSKLQQDIDLLRNEISSYYSKIISARDRTGYIKEKLKKIQSEVSK